MKTAKQKNYLNWDSRLLPKKSKIYFDPSDKFLRTLHNIDARFQYKANIDVTTGYISPRHYVETGP